MRRILARLAGRGVREGAGIVAEAPPAHGRLADVFTPTRPRQGQRSLTGRRTELDRIVSALMEERAHVVLYSERGRGKTSLANSVVEVLRRAEVAVARTTCDAASGFEDIVRGLALDLPASMLAVPAQGAGRGCSAALPEGPLHPGDVVALPSRLTCRFLVCVVDEFDRVRNASVRTQLADTIKQLSDRGVRMLFMMVGVSDSLEQLLGEHLSIQRNVIGLPLPLLSPGQVGELVARGAREAGLGFTPGLVGRIALLSRGMPYMAQLLSLRVAQAAAARGAGMADSLDLAQAAERLVQEAEPRVLSLHAALTRHGSDRAMADALHGVAMADQDLFGRMRVHHDCATVRVGGSVVAPDCWQRMLDAGVVGAGGETPAAIATVADRGLLNHVLLLGVPGRASMGEDPALAPGTAADARATLLAEQG